MKLYVRVLVAGGLIEYGVFAICCVLGYLAGWVWYGVAGVWLLASERFVKRYLLPPLFPHTRHVRSRGETCEWGEPEGRPSPAVAGPTPESPTG